MTTNLSYNTIDKPRIEAAIREFLIGIGEDPDREGLEGTPDRVARACEEIFGGMQEDPSFHLLRQFNEPGNEDMVILKDIPFASMCEHHLLPVSGYARRPQLQERLTNQIADAIEERLHARGVLVVLEAEHTCMCMRGIRAAGSVTVTSAVRGFLKSDLKAREEALNLIGV